MMAFLQSLNDLLDHPQPGSASPQPTKSAVRQAIDPRRKDRPMPAQTEQHDIGLTCDGAVRPTGDGSDLTVLPAGAPA